MRTTPPVPAAPATEAAALDYGWAEQYETTAAALQEAGMPGAADDIRTLVYGLKCWERDGADLRRRNAELVSLVAATEQQRDEAREALTLPQFVASKMFKRAEAAERRAAEAERVLLRIAEPLYDDVLRARLLRQGLSTDEMEQFVEVVELNQKLARAALSAGGPERTTT